MASSTLKSVSCAFHSIDAANPRVRASNPKTLITVSEAMRRDQVRRKEEEDQEDVEPFSMASRRNMMLCLASAPLSGMTVFIRPVEARVGGRLENKRKAREKLEMLKEKAGKLKPKPENKE